MRRLGIVLALLVVAGVFAGPAAAQPPFTFGLNAQGIIQYSTASVSVVNSTTASALWSSTVSGALTATSANANWTPSSVATPPPLHLVLQGQLTTNIGTGAVGNINMGVNYGGGVTGVASLALINGIALPNNMNSAPWTLDVWFSPVATATNGNTPGAGSCYFWLNAELRIASNTASNGLSAPLFFANSVCGTTGGAFLASAEQLNVLMNWASASATNSFNVYRGVLMYGL